MGPSPVFAAAAPGLRESTSAPLRVGLEASDSLNGHRAIGRYVRELPAALLRAARPGEVALRLLLFGRGSGARAREFAASLERSGRARVRALPLPGIVLHTLWTRTRRFPIERLLGPLDLLHAPGFLTPPARRGTPTVLTMHGIVNFVRPDLLEPRFVEELAPKWRVYLERADWVVSVSECARREFLERFDFPPERVRAIPLGVSAEFRPLDPEWAAASLEARFGSRGLERPYILFVGGLQRVKNLAGLLHAYISLRERLRLPHRLVLAGEPQDAAGEIREALRHPALEGRAVFTGHIHQGGAALPLLYGGADLLVQPSFYEGWASPPLEAMACGTPVVASSASSLPESCGGAALHADPGDPRALAAAIERVLTDEGLRRDLVRRGLDWSARWSWDRCARATLDLYREARAAGPRPRPRR